MINQEFLGSVTPEQELKSREGELYLRFYATSNQEFALSATGIREVISAPIDRITPIPNTSHLLLGTLNLRGRIIWVVDLGQLLGEATALNTTRPEISVIAVENQDTVMGLAVNQILGMDWLNVSEVQTSTNVPEMGAFERGQWVVNEHTHQYLRLLDQTVILRSEHWVV